KMSLLDQRRLIESIHPFGLLKKITLDNLMKKIDIAYYAKDTLLISKSISSIAFYIIIKGSVKEVLDNEVVSVYSSGDSFDADALIYDKCESSFIVEEDLICYEIKKDDFLDLLQDKEAQGYFLQDFITRHQQLKNHSMGNELTPFLIAKVSDIYLHSACIVDESESIYGSIKKADEQKSSVIIVRFADKSYGIVSDSNLKKRVLLTQKSLDKPIGSIATPSLVSVDINDFLFNALIIMTQKAIKRVAVIDNGEIVGLLEQLDLLSFFTSRSHLIVVKIDRANGIEDLKEIGDEFKDLILLLKSQGVKVRYISKLISSLNEKVYKKLFELTVPKELQNSCALMVMGSEGREEQTLKSDQDNALIIKDNIDEQLFVEPMLKLNGLLLEFGYEKCKGNIMVSNELYRQSLKGFENHIDKSIFQMSEESFANLSVLFDAKFVAGDSELFKELKKHLHNNFDNRDDLLAHMAKAILNFETPLSLFSGFVLEDKKLDLKKGGIFAIVHGIRMLALQKGLSQTNTIERIKELNNIGVFDKNFALELIESFDTLSSIALGVNLQAINSDEFNKLDPSKLDKIERDLLKDSFKIVNKFKKFITYHFHLNMVL
ncbi:MAG: putative nucleotidyltransferase substrate binding domain-containing protein, partial [Sulfurimonas sp.]